MPDTLKFTLIAVALIAAWYDLRVRRIPNWLTLTGMVLGLGLHFAFLGWPGLVAALAGVLLAALVYLPLYVLKGMGAGDVKLMAAVGALAGPQNWLFIFIATALIGGVAALALIWAKRRSAETITNLGAIVSGLVRGRVPAGANADLSIHSERSLKMPHGAVIAAGVAVFLFATRGQ